jgi:spore coat protein U-like protein
MRWAALILLLASGAAQAGGSNALAVKANVLGNCRFSAPSSTLSFTLDPLGPGSVTQTASVQYRCSKGSSATLALTSVNGNRLVKGAEAIAYTYSSSVSNSNGNGNGVGQDKTLSVIVNISQPAAANVSPGVYTDVIDVTLTP